MKNIIFDFGGIILTVKMKEIVDQKVIVIVKNIKKDINQII